MPEDLPGVLPSDFVTIDELKIKLRIKHGNLDDQLNQIIDEVTSVVETAIYPYAATVPVIPGTALSKRCKYIALAGAAQIYFEDYGQIERSNTKGKRYGTVIEALQVALQAEYNTRSATVTVTRAYAHQRTPNQLRQW